MSGELLQRKAWLVIVFILGMAGCSDRDVQSYLGEAKTLHDKGDYKAAVIQLKNALEKEPQNGEVRYQLGVLYNTTENYAAAEKELLKARELGIGEDRVAPQQVAALLGQGELKRVLDEVPDPKEAKPATRAAVLVGHGNALLGLRRVDEAKSSYDAALRIDPEYAEAHLGYARVEAQSGNLEAALAEIDRTLAKVPESKDALLLKGDLLQALKRVPEAEKAFQEASRVAPNSLAALLKLTSIQLDSGKIGEANTTLEKARKIAPQNLLVQYTQALVEFRQGSLEKARDSLQQVLRSAPGNQPANLLAGIVAHELGDFQLAQNHLGKVLAVAPENQLARKLLASAELKLGNASRAEDILKPLAPEKSSDPVLLALMGEIRLREKDFSGAGQFLERAAAQAPQNPAVRTDLALSRLARGDSARAVADLEAASAINPDFVKADTLLILAHLSNKEFDKALQTLAILEKKRPDDPIVHNLRAAAYLGKNDKSNARKSYERALAVKGDYFTAVANLARMDMQEKKPDVAIKRIQDFLVKNPKNAQAMLAMADMARLAKNEKDYLAWLEKAAAADAQNLAPRTQLVRYWLAKRNPAKALDHARAAVNAHPNSAQALELLGQVQLASGERFNAVSTYKKLVESTPDAPLAHLRLAAAHIMADSPADARRSLEQVLKLAPAHPDALATLALLELRSKHYERAMTLAGQLQKAHPKLIAGHVLEGDVRLAQGKTTEAITVYEGAYKQTPNAGLVQKLYNAHVAAGNPDKAEAVLQQWLKVNPRDIAVRLQLAQRQMQRSNEVGAISQYEAVLKQAPNNVMALNNLAGLYQKARNPNALKTAETAHRLMPDNPAVLDTLGWILVEQGQAARGLVHLRNAQSRMPDQPEIHWHLVYGLHRSGDSARARQELKRLLDSGLAFPQQEEAKTLLKQLGG